jgi:hypothetical protein
MIGFNASDRLDGAKIWYKSTCSGQNLVTYSGFPPVMAADQPYDGLAWMCNRPIQMIKVIFKREALERHIIPLVKDISRTRV